jgi:hypothetical protein
MTSMTKAVPGAESADGRLAWSPQLDLRNCGVDAVKRTVQTLPAAAWEPWLADYILASGGTELEVARASAQFCAGFAAFLKDPSTGLEPNIRAAGFLDAHPAAQVALFTRLGQAFLGYIAYAMGHATLEADGGLPYRAALERLLAAGAEMQRTLTTLAAFVAAEPAEKPQEA